MWWLSQIVSILLLRFSHNLAVMGAIRRAGGTEDDDDIDDDDDLELIFPVNGTRWQKVVSFVALWVVVPFFAISTLMGVAIMFAYASNEVGFGKIKNC